MGAPKGNKNAAKNYVGKAKAAGSFGMALGGFAKGIGKNLGSGMFSSNPFAKVGGAISSDIRNRKNKRKVKSAWNKLTK
jgi:hypothetical protein